jgi:hypothetical protein
MQDIRKLHQLGDLDEALTSVDVGREAYIY